MAKEKKEEKNTWKERVVKNFWLAFSAVAFISWSFGMVEMHIINITLADDIALWEITQVLSALGSPLYKIFGCIFFMAWAGVWAAKPSINVHKADWGKMGWMSQAVTVWSEKYMSLSMITISMAFAVSLAPDALVLGELFKGLIPGK